MLLLENFSALNITSFDHPSEKTPIYQPGRAAHQRYATEQLQQLYYVTKPIATPYVRISQEPTIRRGLVSKDFSAVLSAESEPPHLVSAAPHLISVARRFERNAAWLSKVAQPIANLPAPPHRAGLQIRSPHWLAKQIQK